MQRSNLYIVGFAAVLTIICGGLLALASKGLEPMQKEQIKTDTRKQILSAVMDIKEGMDINAIYEAQINAYVVDVNGEKVEGVDVSKVNTKKVYKEKDVSKKQFPVFEFKNESGALQSYIVPVFGKGLWDDVWGYIAFETDLNTIKGVSFGHKGETPGLGARITEPEVQARFVGKKILASDGSVNSVEFIKGEGVNPPADDNYYEVDGLSGASMTTKGVNKMLENYFGYYNSYFEKLRK